MGTRNAKAEVITYGQASARITTRSDGRCIIRWREAKRGRSTTAPTMIKAREIANKKVRELSAVVGSRMVSVIEAETSQAFRDLCGGRSMTQAMDQLRGWLEALDGWDGMARAVAGALRAGHGTVERVPTREAVVRFLAQHERSSVLYKAGLRKELEGFTEVYGDMCVCDLDQPLLEAWISRPTRHGDPDPRFFNNRLATWKTFLNRCRAWRYWPQGVYHPGLDYVAKGHPHPAELIKRRKLPDVVPPILTVEQGSKAMDVVQRHSPALLPYLVIGGWMGLRPFELTRLTWEAWDWERDYLNVNEKVAAKVMQQRFVPIPPNVRALLQEWLAGPHYRQSRKKCCRRHDREELSLLLRKHDVIDEWPQDVLRHSYISYQLAKGNGRGQVAEWAGNSESEIRKSYRRPLRKEDGTAWFAIELAADRP